MKNIGKIVALLAIPVGLLLGKTVLDKMAGEPSTQSGGVTVRPTSDPAPLGGTVSPELLEILVCPEDKGPLELVETGKYLLNPRNGYRYPIRDGIPIMLIEEGKSNRVAG
ncbi:MAG: Trm112 family protein [Ardenticatenales bacterium]|nr:Trm112 family protein [Ardenticatenales bacterium]